MRKLLNHRFRAITPRITRQGRASHAQAVRAGTRQACMGIESLETRTLLSTYVVNNTADSGAGSLRQAILDANAHLNGYSPSIVDEIIFDTSVFGNGVTKISLSSALPAVTDSVVLDGSLAGGTPGVWLEGSGAGAGADGLDLLGGNTTVRGLVISGFGGNGIVVDQNGGDLIQGNYIGTDATGQGFDGNLNDGILLKNGAQVIGNVISANGNNGVEIKGASGDVLKSNHIGVDTTGTIALGNGGNGVLLDGVTSVTIGGSSTTDGNLIAANAGDGIQIKDGSAYVTITGNLIGTDAAGDAGLGNGANGINVADTSHDVTIGGWFTTDRNVISGNIGAGVQIASGGANVVVRGNFIGTDASGMIAVANWGDGVYVSGGGNALIAMNVISGNYGNGVDIAAGGVASVRGNLIGLAVDGSTSMGNAGSGVYISGSGSTIGGTGATDGNVIAYNGENGVTVVAGGVGNSIRGNSIFSNALIGIDLGNDGVTLNDSQGHVGPNNYLDFPVITTVTFNADGTVTISGTVSVLGAGTVLLDFYGNAAPNASNYGEGQSYLGSTSLNATGAGSVSFKVTLASIPAGQTYVTATATDAAGNTSEFSKAVQGVAAPVQPTLASTTTLLSSSLNPSIFGQIVTFTASITGGSNCTGTVDFVETLADGSTLVLGTGTVSNGVAKFTTSALAIGSHQITAVYHGDAANAASTSAALTQVVKTDKVTISGHTFNDVSGNGLSADDTLLGGVTVKLYQDTNGNGKIDSADKLIATVVTGSDGSYSFGNLASGKYLVQEVTPSGYVRTAPALSDTYAITAPAGSIFAGEDFDNYKSCSCSSSVTNISYVVITPGGCSHTYTDLRGHTEEGDTVIVKFTVAKGQTATVSLISYTAPSNTFVASQAANQVVYEFATGTFSSGVHTMTVVIPKCCYQVDFVCGKLIDHFGPANSNVFYSAQNRLFSADNGGTHTQFSVLQATDMSALNT